MSAREGGQAPRPRRLADVGWEDWRPRDTATLVFVLRDAEVLLIHKKRGLGAGKINGPGGRLEPGETLRECAVREVQEELCVTPRDLAWGGENRFHFADGYSIHVHVYRAHALEGTPRETEEAVPLWVPRDAIPYHQMWEDDRIWIPHLLAGRRFAGRFLFESVESDRMLDHALEVETASGATRAASGHPPPDAGS